MKRNMFYVWLVLAAAVWAVVSLGGCGGSSSSSGSGGNSSPEGDPTMSEIWDDDEAVDEIFSRLTSEDVLRLLTARMEILEKKQDGSVTMEYFNMGDFALNDREYPEVPYDPAELLEHYQSGDMILIAPADLELVNRVRTDLGLPEENSAKFGQSGSLEVYGLACVKADGLRNLFVYIVPKMGDITASDEFRTGDSAGTANPDAASLESETISTDEQPEVSPAEYTMRDFQIDRWVNFLKWMGEMGLMARRNAQSAAELRIYSAANDDIAAISDAQTETFNFSYSNVHANGPSFDGKHYSSTEFNRTRNNFVTVKVFSAHSFTSGKDYYVVQSTTTTIPKNFANVKIEYNGYHCKYAYGYTRSVGTEHHIDGGTMSTSDVALVKNAPSNINDSQSHTEGMEWEVNGKVGVNKDGLAAEVGGGVKYSNSTTWTTTEYKIVNSSMNEYSASAKWYADVQTPSDGTLHYVGAPFKYYDDVNEKPASRNQLQYDAYFMWEVSRNYWKANPSMRMWLTFKVEDGVTSGWCNQGFMKYDLFHSTYSTTKSDSLILRQPAHTAVSQGTFAFTASGASAQSFTLLAEDSWTIKDIPSWLHFTETSGNATGSTDKLLLFDVEANSTGSPRSATLTIESGRDEIAVQIAQTGN